MSHKEKNNYFTKEIDEVRAMNKIGVNLSQEKKDFTNDAYQKELQYWKKVVLESVLTENGRKQLTDLAPPKGFLARNTAIKNVKRTYSDAREHTFP